MKIAKGDSNLLYNFKERKESNPIKVNILNTTTNINNINDIPSYPLTTIAKCH